VLDEPTTGLHFEDIRRLLQVLGKLVDQGNTVVVIEHNLDVIKTADHVIDMGPEGGSRGGAVLVVGTPEEVAAHPASHTGTFLAPMLKGREVPMGQAALVGETPAPIKKTTASKTTAKKATASRATAKKATAKKATAKKATARKSAPTTPS